MSITIRIIIVAGISIFCNIVHNYYNYYNAAEATSSVDATAPSMSFSDPAVILLKHGIVRVPSSETQLLQGL